MSEKYGRQQTLFENEVSATRDSGSVTVIVAVADKIPNNVLEEDPKLLMWYDQAVTRMGNSEGRQK